MYNIFGVLFWVNALFIYREKNWREKCVVEALQSAENLCNRAVYLFKIKNNKVSKTNLHKLLKAIVEFEFSGIHKDCCEIQTLKNIDNF